MIPAGIQQGLQSLKDGGVPPKFLIIDDGWQQTGPDSVGVKQSTVRLEAKKEVRIKFEAPHCATPRLACASSKIVHNSQAITIDYC